MPAHCTAFGTEPTCDRRDGRHDEREWIRFHLRPVQARTTRPAEAKRWSDAFATAAGGVFSSPAERNELMLATIKEFSTYFVSLIEARRAEPKGDLVSAMVAAIDNESLSTVETLMVAITIMVAGNETTTNLIGNTVVELLANPDQLQLLLDDPGLLPDAVDEANRLSCPIQFAYPPCISCPSQVMCFVQQGQSASRRRSRLWYKGLNLLGAKY